MRYIFGVLIAMMALAGIGSAVMSTYTDTSTDGVIDIGMTANHTMASTDLYPGYKVSYLQAFGWDHQMLPSTPLVPVVGFR